MRNTRLELSATILATALLCGCAPGVTLTREAKLTQALQGVTSLQSDIAVENVAALRSLDILASKPAAPTDPDPLKPFRSLFCDVHFEVTSAYTNVVSDRAKRLDKYAKAPDAGLANALAAIQKESEAYKKLNQPQPPSFDIPGGKDEILRAAKCETIVRKDLDPRGAPGVESAHRFGGATAIIGFVSALSDALNALAGYAEKRQRAELVMAAAGAFKPDVTTSITSLMQCIGVDGKPTDCKKEPVQGVTDTDGTALIVFEYPVARHRFLAMQRARAAYVEALPMADSYKKHVLVAYAAKEVAEWNALFDMEFSVNDDHTAMQRSLPVVLQKMNETLGQTFDALASGAPPGNSDEQVAALTEMISDLKALSDKRDAYWKAWRGRLD